MTKINTNILDNVSVVESLLPISKTLGVLYLTILKENN